MGTPDNVLEMRAAPPTKLGALAIALVSLCLAGSVGGFVLCMVAIRWNSTGKIPGFGDGLRVLPVMFIYASMLSIVPAVICVVRYKRFLRLPPAVQRTLAMLRVGWDIVLLLIVAGIIFFRG